MGEMVDVHVRLGVSGLFRQTELGGWESLWSLLFLVFVSLGWRGYTHGVSRAGDGRWGFGVGLLRCAFLILLNVTSSVKFLLRRD